MIDELLKLKKVVDGILETYKELHPDEEDENYHLGRGHWETHDRGNNTHLDGMSEYNQKQQALKKRREGKYESAFREKQRENLAEPSEGSPSLCVYGDS